MARLADLLEDYRNWRGRQEWQQGYENDQFAQGDPGLTQLFDDMYANPAIGGFVKPEPYSPERMKSVENWIKKQLSNGGLSPQELWDRGRMAGFNEPEVYQARLNLYGTNRPDGNGGYITELPQGLTNLLRR